MATKKKYPALPSYRAQAGTFRTRRENKINTLTNKGESLSAAGQDQIGLGTIKEARANELYDKASNATGLLTGPKSLIYETAANVKDYRASNIMGRGRNKIEKGEKMSDRAGRIATRLNRRDVRRANRM